MSYDLGDYVEVSERIQHFRDMFPEGTLQSEIVSWGDGVVVVKAYAYRAPEDPRPGIGMAAEPVPGKTPYTKDSELQNCETSAWGRAIIAVGASDAKRGVASANEVRNRQVLSLTLDDLDAKMKEAEAAGVEGDYGAMLETCTDDPSKIGGAIRKLDVAIAKRGGS